jgi:uncharacterized membrane-anchored protein YjiN (DUF445 family)
MTAKRNRIGTYFLLGALAGFLFFSFQPWLHLEAIVILPGLSLKKLVLAFFDASLVGALADWFAVTALFRDPLGVHLPHTNILARNKDNIALAIPRFLTGFVTYERIGQELAKVDFSEKLEKLLSGPETRGELHGLIRSRLADFLSSYSTGGGSRIDSLNSFVGELCAFAVEEIDPAPGAADLLRWARHEAFDERVIEGAAEFLRSEMGRNRLRLAAAITPIVKRGAGWKGLFISQGNMEDVLRSIEEELAAVQADRNNELRLFLVSSLEGFAASLASREPNADKERFSAGVRDALRDKSFQQGLAAFAADLLSRLGLDLGDEASRFISGLERIEDGLVLQLERDPELRNRFNAGVASLVSSFVARGRFIEGLADYFAKLLRETETKVFIENIEDSVWNDLQYIRVNGSVVGGLVGLVLSILSSFFPA